MPKRGKRKREGQAKSSTNKKNVQSHPDAPTPKKSKSIPLPPSSSIQTDVILPLSYPHSSSLPIPNSSFLRDVGDYKASFRKALDTSYLGFEIDNYDNNEKECCSSRQMEQGLFNHDLIEKALLTMDKHGLFRTDVTQPVSNK